MDVAPEAAPSKILTPRRTDVAHAWLTSPVYIELVSEAQRQRVHPDRLAAMLIEACVLGGLVDAVLARGLRS
jgi:hypothetical protein